MDNKIKAFYNNYYNKGDCGISCNVDPTGLPYLYMYYKGSIYILKVHPDGNVMLQKSVDSGKSWTNLANFLDIPKKLDAIGASTPTVTSKLLKTNNCDAYQKNHLVTIAICLETTASASGTWRDYTLATINYKPNHVVRTVLVNQDNGMTIPLRIDTAGNMILEVKGTAMDSSWLYGGITYGYN